MKGVNVSSLPTPNHKSTPIKTSSIFHLLMLLYDTLKQCQCQQANGKRVQVQKDVVSLVITSTLTWAKAHEDINEHTQ